ncbi:MAG: carbamoyltransferase [Pyrinomonadaceae bacterium]|nr:carbamoyltransferase [Acidobacteriota bacterium]MBP7376631.1 carbamoyltransferase [Pyrinomonadaceae bacterium]
MVNILGISAFYHDSAACLVQDGDIVAAAQEERFTRKKHDESFPAQAMEFCLEFAGITRDDIDHVVFYDKPLLTFERLLETYIDFAPRGFRSYLKAMPVWLTEKLWTRETIRKQTGFEGKVLFTEHHQAHAASAFFPSPFEHAAILTIDGVGEWATSSYGIGNGNELDILAELRFPHSLGLLYSAFTYFTGFKVNSGEYKLMGLAPYGEPVYVKTILDNLIDLRGDGSLRLNMEYFDFAAGLRMTNKKFAALFGGPERSPETKLTQREMNLARSVQEVTEMAMLRMANHLHKETGETNLCLAGGVALNCVANGRILRETPFENIWIEPAAGDAGGALGAALSVWHQYLGNERKVGPRDSIKGSLLGPEFSKAVVRKVLDDAGAVYLELAETKMIDRVARLLADGKIVGWFQGRMEFGPRALGGRSILGDPRSAEMQSRMNLKIKFRESFRPFAPAVLCERASEYFDLDSDSPYMLLVAAVSERQRVAASDDGVRGLDKLRIPRSRIPAVTHVDHSARVQTVTREGNARFFDLITRFGEITGDPVLINTSFNVRGEPIVCTPADAFRCFMRTGMDYLVLGDIVLDKNDQTAAIAMESDWHAEFPLD